MKPAFTFKIGGEAGFGIMSAGKAFSKVAIRSGYHTFDYTEYPSLIRGGHNVMQTTVSPEPVYSQYETTEVLVALNQETIELHKHELVKSSIVIYDPDQEIDVSEIKNDTHCYPIPLTEIVRNAKGSMVMRNTVGLASAIALLGGNLQHLKDVLDEKFRGKKKKEHLIEINHEVCDGGYNYVHENYKSDVRDIMPQRDNVETQILVTGNEATALGAIAGGMTFAAIYPMTPTSNILHTLAPHQEEYGYVYKQPEDEIGAINMAIGAAFAGARSMVATSGGGFCLMAEGYGLAGLTETPVVVIEGMRGAPATGLPTWTEQGDLRFVLHAHQGDFPRIVMAPGDVEEAFYMSLKAFNLAEKYQTPVLILIDKYICESHMSTAPFDTSDFEIDRGKFTMEKLEEDYERYALSEDGISLRSTPGTGNHFVANSDEHDGHGYSNEESENRIEQMNKRMQKLETCREQDMEKPQFFGPGDAEVTLVSWGSNKGPILEALKHTDKANFLHITWANPFPAREVRRVLENAKNIVNVECNYSAQMGGLIREKTGIDIKDNLLKYDGRPFYPEEIVEKVRSITG